MPTKPLRIFVFGGSQGARQLNEHVPEALAKLAEGSIEVFHQTGETDRVAVAARYAELGIQAEVVAFERDMPKRYAWADLAICRAGALTVAELALAGMPALVVPYPFAADDHQTANARALEEAGAARRIPAQPLDVHALAQTIAELVTTPGRLAPDAPGVRPPRAAARRDRHHRALRRQLDGGAAPRGPARRRIGSAHESPASNASISSASAGSAWPPSPSCSTPAASP